MNKQASGATHNDGNISWGVRSRRSSAKFVLAFACDKPIPLSNFEAGPSALHWHSKQTNIYIQTTDVIHELSGPKWLTLCPWFHILLSFLLLAAAYALGIGSSFPPPSKQTARAKKKPTMNLMRILAEYSLLENGW